MYWYCFWGKSAILTFLILCPCLVHLPIGTLSNLGYYIKDFNTSFTPIFKTGTVLSLCIQDFWPDQIRTRFRRATSCKWWSTHCVIIWGQFFGSFYHWKRIKIWQFLDKLVKKKRDWELCTRVVVWLMVRCTKLIPAITIYNHDEMCLM